MKMPQWFRKTKVTDYQVFKNNKIPSAENAFVKTCRHCDLRFTQTFAQGDICLECLEDHKIHRHVDYARLW
jgi:hypothetical protein